MMHRSAALLAIPILALAFQRPIQQPKGTWQKPGEIQQPKGKWQTPGEIQVPKGIQAIRTEKKECEGRWIAGSDALFAFNEAKLSADAEETLRVLGPMLKEKAGTHPVSIEGHTDAIGGDAYNQELSERRADAVRAWMVDRGYLAAGHLAVKGYGRKRPAAPNTKPDGSDDPSGRQKNRRVEIVINTCG